MLLHPVTWGHQSFPLNQHLNADGTTNQTYVENTVILDSRRIQSGFRDVRDPLHLAQGGTLGRVHKGMTAVHLTGRIVVPKATQRASLSDKERAFLVAFDPYQCYVDSPSTDGVYAFDFSEDTADTATYTSGLIPLRYYCRPADKPTLDEHLNDRGQRPFSLALIAGDPRQYEQTEQTLTLTPGSPTGSVVNRGNVAAPVKAVITMNGAGLDTFALYGGAGAPFHGLKIAGSVNNDVFTIIFETSGPYGAGRRVLYNGTDSFGIEAHTIIENPTKWLKAEPGTFTWGLTNSTNVRTCVLTWYSARA